MTIDFFVHPQFSESKKIHEYPYLMKDYERYFQHLLYNLSTSDIPVLIKGRGDTFFEMEIPLENQFNSNNYGEITSSEAWQRFVKLLEGFETEEMRINGCYFGQCARNFALQLFTYLKIDENLFTEDGSYGNSRIETQKVCQYFGDFLRSNIKYGAVLHRCKEEHIIQKLKSKNLPFGNIDKQLVDSQTSIYFG